MGVNGVPLVFLLFCVTSPWLSNASPSATGRSASLKAAAALCPAACPVSECSFYEPRIAAAVQNLTTATVLTCDSLHRPAFLEAIALFQPSGYPEDLNVVPYIVVQPSETAEVQQAVKAAVQHNLTLAVKGGGYSWRAMFLASRGMTIDLSAHMNAVRVDPVRQEVVVQGGAIYADIEAATKPYGLAVPWGDAEQTGVGLALGGGIGYLMRTHGLTCDNIINATVVLANGTQVAANASTNTDLLALMRGGGAVFGVVTELALWAHSVTNYHAGIIIYTDDTQCTTLRALHKWAAEVMAQEPSAGIEIIQSSTTPDNRTVGVQVGMPSTVLDKDRQQLLAPLKRLPNILKDSLDQLDYFEFEETVTAVGDAQNYLSQYFISAVLTFHQAEAGLLDKMPELLYDVPADVTTFYLADYWGSTVSENAVRKTTSLTPFGGDLDFHFFIKYQWPTSANNTAHTIFAQDRIKLMAPYVTSTQSYYNLATIVSNASLEYQVGGAHNLASLRHVKQQLDPTNLFKQHGFVGL